MRSLDINKCIIIIVVVVVVVVVVKASMKGSFVGGWLGWLACGLYLQGAFRGLGWTIICRGLEKWNIAIQLLKKGKKIKVILHETNKMCLLSYFK